ncbi:predicted protein [Chaetomium globosum CBS 148.51]|uniref:Uncharacterized protein n=1 Tax=Chaetomium globosum (strain ATCC 6205 / CBS 148.51 / DSM 1962 / NBRC 6347 / NRRL 1970) TaxID=306901 RepID=Q2HCA6_CHAGB|nr:uncharacterized protein CHGG_02148 [Chaetomium globosum CBS 148.51]EAQ90213.1 predicted protein [Chaetomium globosum CBS 148.51]
MPLHLHKENGSAPPMWRAAEMPCTLSFYLTHKGTLAERGAKPIRWQEHFMRFLYTSLVGRCPLAQHIRCALAAVKVRRQARLSGPHVEGGNDSRIKKRRAGRFGPSE